MNARPWLRRVALPIACCATLLIAACDDGGSSNDDVAPVDGVDASDTSPADGDDTASSDGNGDDATPDSDTSDTSDAGDTAADVNDMADPCAGISDCSNETRVCDAGTLLECAPDANGCLVVTRTECAALPGGGFCDDTGETPVCVTDPCAGVANPCATEAAACSGTDLVVCAPDPFGCLVETTTDCASVGNGACDDSGARATCTGDVDCASVADACDAAATGCVGPELVVCAPDAFGCLVETRADCTDVSHGFCDDAASPAQCDIALEDPCAGVIACAPEGRACDGDSLVVCAPDTAGCLVETTTDCAQAGQVCDATASPVACRSACTDACAVAGNTCDGSRETRCADTHADGCLELTVVDCAASDLVCDVGSGLCVANGSGETCADPLIVQSNGVDPTSFVLSGSDFTADFADDLVRPTGEGCATDWNEAVPDAVVEIQLAAGDTLTVSEHGGLNPVVNLVAACDATICLDGFTPSGSIHYEAAVDETVFLLIESRLSTTYDYELHADVTPAQCGDAVVALTEGCDDGNTSDGDGCSADCQVIESGFVCTEGLCYPTGAGDTCAAPIALSAPAVFTIDTTGFADDYATYSGCSATGGAGADVVFSLEVQPGEVVDVTGFDFDNSDFAHALVLSNACGSPTLEEGCLAYGVESFGGLAAPRVASVSWTHEGSTATSVQLVVDGAGDTQASAGEVQITVATRALTCGDGFVDGPEACDDGNTSAGDGCSATCTLEGETCADAIALTGSATVVVDTTAYANDYATWLGACTGQEHAGRDAVYALTLAAGEAVAVSGGFSSFGRSAALAMFTDCAAADTSCVDAATGGFGGGPAIEHFNGGGAPQTVFIVADGAGTFDEGTMTLEVVVSVPVCGNGTSEPGEACDDGNTSAGDGCSASCELE